MSERVTDEEIESAERKAFDQMCREVEAIGAEVPPTRAPRDHAAAAAQQAG